NSSPRGASCQLAGIDDAVRRSWQLRPRGAGRNELCTGSNQPMDLTRRNFLQASLASTLIPALARAADRDAPRILLRSSWQIVNIGDIAHTPGVLALIERYLPEAEVRLWASNDLSDEVAAMEHRRFPKLQIVKGSIGDDGRASNDEL